MISILTFSVNLCGQSAENMPENKKTSDRLVGQDGYLKQQFIESCLEKKITKFLQ